METQLNNIMFFQKHQKELISQRGRNNTSLAVPYLTPQVNTRKISFCVPPVPIELPELELTVAQSPKKCDRSKSGMKVYQKFKPSLEQQSPFLDTTAFEYNTNRMQQHFTSMSKNYDQKCTESGYPPKIVTLIIKQLTEGISKQDVKILDVGCGKGQVGKYLQHDGFMNVHGIDLSKSLLESAKSTKAYKTLEKAVIGQYQWKLGFEATSEHSEKYDFVVASSMINNDGWDGDVFKQLLNMTKMGGTIIFATKLMLDQKDLYSEYIQNLTSEHYWRPQTMHEFYKYDLQCDGSGKFTNKMVKIMAFEKTDHEVWAKIQNALREKTLKEAFEKEKVRKQMAQAIQNKLNRAEIARKARKEKEIQDKKDAQEAEQNALEQQKNDEAEAEKKEKQKKINRDRMMANLKKKIQELMWIKLKENQKIEVERINVLQKKATIKRMETLSSKNMQTMMNIRRRPSSIDCSESSPTKFNQAG